MRCRPLTTRFVLFFLTLALFSGCDPWFAFSPYEAHLEKKYHGTTENNLARISAINTNETGSFKVALLSDTHYHFRKLEDAIADINKKGDYQFVIVTGDLTENGLKQEFVYFYRAMQNLEIPWLTVIGNHDYLANGEIVYSQMFGPFNYSFVFNHVKFVFFDNTTIESSKEPDLAWLARELVNEGAYDHVIPFAHIPPYDGQMKNHDRAFHQLITKNNISLSVHGHRHDYTLEDVYGDGVKYLTISSPQKRSYAELVISPSGLSVKKIEY